MRLLQVISTVDPACGGVAEGMVQSGLACMQLGHDVEVATLDDPSAKFLAGYPLPVHAVGPGISAWAYSSRLVPWLKANLERFDVVVVHALWQYHGFAVWRALRKSPVPYVVFPHGMLDPWFKRTYPTKHLKKWLFWPWSDYRLLRDAQAVLFTCEEERRLASQSFWLYRAREVVVSFGTAVPAGDGPRQRELYHSAFPKLQGRRQLLFLSRIHPKKGCDILIEAFARVAREWPDLDLVMAGPDHGDWQASLQAKAAELGVASRIFWPAMLRDDLKWGAFHSAEAYVLPSHQENFGVAVAEALACGVPVLISDKVNIWREISSASAGIVQPDTADGTERALRQWLTLTPPARAEMARNASDLFRARFTIDAMARSLIDVLERVVSRRPQP